MNGRRKHAFGWQKEGGKDKGISSILHDFKSLSKGNSV